MDCNHDVFLKAANARPELVNHIDNIEDYDVVFLGFPNWWYTAPMAIFSFIEEYDFSGKTVVPFCAHGTGGLVSSTADITAALPASAYKGNTPSVRRFYINSMTAISTPTATIATAKMIIGSFEVFSSS